MWLDLWLVAGLVGVVGILWLFARYIDWRDNPKPIRMKGTKWW